MKMRDLYKMKVNQNAFSGVDKKFAETFDERARAYFIDLIESDLYDDKQYMVLSDNLTPFKNETLKLRIQHFIREGNLLEYCLDCQKQWDVLGYEALDYLVALIDQDMKDTSMEIKLVRIVDKEDLKKKVLEYKEYMLELEGLYAFTTNVAKTK